VQPKRIGFIGFDGVIASQLIVPSDIFAAASLEVGYGNRIGCYDIAVIGLRAAAFRAESGVILQPTETLETVSEIDTVIVPGGRGLRAAEMNHAISEWILTNVSRIRRIAAIDTGISAVAPTGLLDGREVAVDEQHVDDVKRHFPQMRLNCQRPLVKDGSFYTSSGLGAAVDLSLTLIEEDYGGQVASATAQQMPFSNQLAGKDFSRPAQFDSQPCDRFADLVAWIMRNLNRHLSIDVLARKASMSPTHLNRAFKNAFGVTPGTFVENLRLNEARRRLLSPKDTLYTVAASVGFSNPSAFRRAFERRFGTKPSQLAAAVPELKPILVNGGTAPRVER
jgi:transcriptional regulator GlxA family with amidase domain